MQLLKPLGLQLLVGAVGCQSAGYQQADTSYYDGGSYGSYESEDGSEYTQDGQNYQPRQTFASYGNRSYQQNYESNGQPGTSVGRYGKMTKRQIARSYSNSSCNYG